jgi:hypothetical protein
LLAAVVVLVVMLDIIQTMPHSVLEVVEVVKVVHLPQFQNLDHLLVVVMVEKEVPMFGLITQLWMANLVQVVAAVLRDVLLVMQVLEDLVDLDLLLFHTQHKELCHT